jgi:hypothetical protein
MRKFIVIVLIAVIVCVLGALGYEYFMKEDNHADLPVIVETVEVETEAEVEPETSVEEIPPVEEEVPAEETETETEEV